MHVFASNIAKRERERELSIAGSGITTQAVDKFISQHISSFVILLFYRIIECKKYVLNYIRGMEKSFLTGDAISFSEK